MSRQGLDQIPLRDEDISFIEVGGQFQHGVRYKGEFYRMATIRFKRKMPQADMYYLFQYLGRKMRKRLLKIQGEGCLGVLEAPHIFLRDKVVEVVAIVVGLPAGVQLDCIERQPLDEWMQMTRKDILGA